MVSHPENGSDSPIGSDRDRGRDTMCASARVAPSNIVYQWYGYRSTGIGVLNTKIGFLNIIWIYVLCERVLVTEFKLNY